MWTLAPSDLEALGQRHLEELEATAAATPDDEARADLVAASSPAPTGGWRQSVAAVHAQRKAAPDEWAPFLAGDLGASTRRDAEDLARWRRRLAEDYAFAGGELPDPSGVLAAMETENAERAAAVEASPARVVAHGIDTLHVSVWCHIADTVRSRLAALRDQAEASGVVIGSGDLRWTLAPHGRRGGYRYLLEGPACSIAIRGRDLEDQASVFVELRSAWLWRYGPRRCMAELLRVLRAWGPSSQEWPPRVTVARVDLAADVQGWAPSGEELTAPLGLAPVWVSRTVARTRYAEPVKAGTRAKDLGADALHLRGRRFTGYSFGSGDLLCRIYDKIAEVKKSGKRWIGAVWEAGGADPAEGVWRVEFQLRGDAIRELVVAVCDPRAQAVAARSTDWHVILLALDGLWSYLTARHGKGWLDLRTCPPDDSVALERAVKLGRFDRWGRDRSWVAISALRWGPESEIARLRSDSPPTVRQMAAAAAPVVSEIKPMRPEDSRGAPSAAAIARMAGRLETISAAAAVRDQATGEARALVAHLGIESAAERADRLRAQLVGTAATYAASLAAARGEDAPPHDEGARALILAALDWALTGAAASAPPPTAAAPGLAQLVRVRSARGPVAAAVRRDLRSASGVWRSQ